MHVALLKLSVNSPQTRQTPTWGPCTVSDSRLLLQHMLHEPPLIVQGEARSWWSRGAHATTDQSLGSVARRSIRGSEAISVNFSPVNRANYYGDVSTMRWLPPMYDERAERVPRSVPSVGRSTSLSKDHLL